jgi:hypothetical protein
MSGEYPTDEELQQLRDWDFNDMRGWFDFAQSIGNYWPDDHFWSEEPPGTFHISTGGWSGNEDIISAMSDNFICWTQTWKVHRRGGHYEFELPAVSRDTQLGIGEHP